jgi:MYXO-CTERM domain-containing protein
VTENSSSSSSGGGALDVCVLWALLGILGLRTARRGFRRRP